MSRQVKNIINISVFLICIALINFAGQNIELEIRGINAFTFILIVAVLVQVIFFIPSFLFKTEKYYDLVGSLTYITTISFAYFAVENKTTIDSIIYFYVMIWASRLGIYLFRRVQKDGKDVRFEKAKMHFFWFLQYWMGQALWVSLTACAAIIAILSPEDDSLPVLTMVGMALWLTGFTIESVSDYQKRAFRKENNSSQSFIYTGLWARSRHPNYFGEITLWVGIAVIALNTLSGVEYITLISPVFVYILLTRMSGINLLEPIADERYGDLEEYQRYKRNTPVLIPKLSKDKK
jgi:steroid 5-alpha reductase family enzyme